MEEAEEMEAAEKRKAKRKVSDATGPSAADEGQDMGDGAGQPQAPVEAEEAEESDTISASAVDQDQNMADDASQPQAPVDNVDKALKILVRNVTEEFGFAPRDVYNGVFNFTETKSEHTTEVRRLNYSRLKAIVEAYSKTGELPRFSERVVAVYPRYVTSDHDEWVIDFKSIRIAREVAKLMDSAERTRLREMYGLFREIPEGSTLAG